MESFYARTVFFVKHAEVSLTFYTQTLGLEIDWNNPYECCAWVFQVSLFGFELFLNQVHGPIRDRAGHGRVFLGLEDDQAAALVPHIRERGIHASRDEWGRPALLLLDPDGNQPYFWVTDRAWERLTL